MGTKALGKRKVPILENPLQINWGARAIGEKIGRTERQTYALLENGQIPGVRKVGTQWCASDDVLRHALADVRMEAK